ncbi:MAG: mucoidy inhibitor MuiA family protein [Bacteroidota bacterium]
MKYTFSLMLFVGSCLSIQAQQILKSQIKQVTVYLQGAELVQESSSALPKGKSTLVFDGLSANMQPESVVLECSENDVTIQSVTIRNNYLKELKQNASIENLKERQAKLQKDISKLQAEKGVYQREREILFRNEAIGGTSNNVPIAEIEKAANFFRQRNTEINIFLLQAEEQEAKLNTELRQVNQQLSELNASINPPTSEVTIVIDCKSSVNATFSLKYLVRNAGWAPKYDVRAANAVDPVVLDYHANVFNNSGLDWVDVKMILSTAEPLQGAEKPEMGVWDLADQLQQVAGVQKNLEMVTILEASKGRSDYLGDGEKEEVSFNNVSIPELTSEFDIPNPYSILSDGKPYVVDVTQYTLPATYMHYAVPKQDGDAFLTAKVVGWNTLNLVSGKASVFFAGAYLGQSFINTASVDDTLSLSLGRDKRIAMSRKKQSELSKRQFIGNNEKETFYFETTVRNNRDKPIQFLLEDQLPISSNGDIEVGMLEISGAEIEKNTGRLSWRFTINPGESKTVVLGYSVKSPKGKSVYKTKFRTVACPSF